MAEEKIRTQALATLMKLKNAIENKAITGVVVGDNELAALYVFTTDLMAENVELKREIAEWND